MDMMEFLKENNLTLQFESTSKGIMSRNGNKTKVSITLIDFDPNTGLEAIYLAEGISPGRHIPCGVVGVGDSINEALTDMFKQIQGKLVAMMNNNNIPAETIRTVTFPEVIRRNELETLEKELNLSID
mgnify:CR=1 FL=1